MSAQVTGRQRKSRVHAGPSAARGRELKRSAVANSGSLPIRGAQTVHRAIDLLQVFTIDRPSLLLAELSESVGLTMPTTHRLLKALQAKEMVVWDAFSRRYSLGAGIIRLAGVIAQRDDIVSIAESGLQRLRTTTEETVGLHWLVGDRRVCMLELTSHHPLRMASGVGHAYPVTAGAAGKAMLAWLPIEEVGRLIAEGLPHRTQREAAALLSELEVIRKVGYATSVGETVAGASAIASAIRNSGGRVIAVINITGPADRFTPQRVAQAAPQLLTEARRIMRILGFPEHDGDGHGSEIKSIPVAVKRQGARRPDGPSRPSRPSR